MVQPFQRRVKGGNRASFEFFTQLEASCYSLVEPMHGRLPAAKDDITGRIVGVFQDLISDGSLEPGGRLPAERDLAEKFGVSRSSLRQALKVLEIMGVISQRVGDGTYLNAGAPSFLSEPMDFLIRLD